MNAHANSELPEHPEISVPVKVYFFDTDAGGVVHNVAYLRMVEIARSDLAEKLGWTLKAMSADECPVVARTEIDYLKPARLGDDLKVHSRLAGMEKIRFYIETVISNAANGEVFCRCRQTMVTVQLGSGRPRSLRKDWRARWPHLIDE
ncbi:MAG: acyl-CoA thioesterase [Verrucomicrobiales bacterium]|jgi:YbgC/YbaW family acyl-CoA thioester hydrolase|nr:acyl-CoA thioesterase [Verrucomicrobiales bacterium]